MFTKPEIHPPQKTRKQSAEEINRAMTRFPMIIEILGELSKSGFPFPGDEDLRRGCERAITSMLVELARIEPAPPGKITPPEEAARNWLNASSAEHLVNADQLQRMQQFIERILGSSRNQH
jgi:hypothetical protein